MEEGLGEGRRGGPAEGDDDARGVREERGGEGDGGVEVLADEEVAVVEGDGGDFDEELAGAGGGLRDGVELEAVGGGGSIWGLGGDGGDIRVPDLAGFAVGFLDGEGVGHGGRCGGLGLCG